MVFCGNDRISNGCGDFSDFPEKKRKKGAANSLKKSGEGEGWPFCREMSKSICPTEPA
jgi:hypothetical protein